MSYLHGKEKIQYILLFYHLYNLISYRLSFLDIFDELAMITLGTHAITKKGYLRQRLIGLNKSQSLRYIIPRSLGQVAGNLLRSILQPTNQVTPRIFNWINQIDYSLSSLLEFLQLLLVALGPIF